MPFHDLRLWIARLLIVLAPSCVAQTTASSGFHWINFKQESDIVRRVEKALSRKQYSAIREIGLVGDSALVFTTSREADSDTPQSDSWTVYNVSVKSATSVTLLDGYDVHIAAWLTFVPGQRDLAVTYLTCSECEPAKLFTGFHYDDPSGWHARWPAKVAGQQPGILLTVSDVGDPYTDEDVDQVWAAIQPSASTAAIGTWYHSRDLHTGKITSTAMKFLVDSNDRDKAFQLHGDEAEQWERSLCKSSDHVYELREGQDSKSCKHLSPAKTSPAAPAPRN